MANSAPYFRPKMARARAALADIARQGRNAGSDHLVVTLRGEIGEAGPVSLASVKAQLEKAPHARRMKILINSPGGNVREALKIHAALLEHPATKSARVITQCASAAVLPFLAADHRELAAGAQLFIHNAALPGACPRRQTAKHLRAVAEAVAAVDDQMLDVLTARTGFSRSHFIKMMRADRPMRPVDALQCGIVHEAEGCPVSRPCDPRWALAVRGSSTREMLIGLPRHLMTANYLTACRAVAAWRGRS